MSVSILVRDEQSTGVVDRRFTLEFPTELITVRELIRERVYQEVDDHNRAKRESFSGLVRPEYQSGHVDSKPRAHKPINWKPQFEKAIAAFEQHGILLLVDDRQTRSLDEVVHLRQGSEVTFIRLVMLVGG